MTTHSRLAVTLERRSQARRGHVTVLSKGDGQNSCDVRSSHRRSRKPCGGRGITNPSRQDVDARCESMDNGTDEFSEKSDIVRRDSHIDEPAVVAEVGDLIGATVDSADRVSSGNVCRGSVSSISGVVS